MKDNIAAFGGDPKRITVAGESAGSMSASAQMASPLSRDLIAGVIGESGSALSLRRRTPLKGAGAQGEQFASALGLKTAEALRAAPVQQIFESAGKPGVARFNAIVDGHFFPELALNIYTAGKQAHVPLLAGWNSEEQNARMILGKEKPTVATNLASDLFIGLATWQWTDMAAKTGGKPVYRYYYERPRELRAE